jgi:UDP-GlcNAc:undecaprenyl-phosphate GlcNAc-1-phosphate transferase
MIGYKGPVYFAFLLAILISLVVSPLAIYLARRLGFIDWPGRSEHNKHEFPTPLAGGFILFFSIIVLSLAGQIPRTILPILPGALVILIFGALDDKYGFSARPKLLGQFMGAIAVIVQGTQVHFLESLFGFNPSSWYTLTLEVGLTLFWIIGITNAFNLVDSMDGLATGLSAISFGLFGFACLEANQVDLATLCVVMMGISIGIYYFNASPARMFLGDSGAQTMGFLLAVVALNYNPQGFSQGSSWFLPILILAVPIFDTTLIVVSRIRRRKPIYEGQLDHTYHRLAGWGFDRSRAVLVMHIISLIIGTIAFVILSLAPVYANLIMAGFIILGVMAIVYFDAKQRWP